MAENSVNDDPEAGEKTGSSSVPLPSPNPTTNLLIADIVVRGASSLLRRDVNERVAKASSESEDEARDALDGHTLLRTLALYGASKLAMRSKGGLALVAGGLALKTLYDRGKSRQKRLAQDKPHSSKTS